MKTLDFIAPANMYIEVLHERKDSTFYCPVQFLDEHIYLNGKKIKEFVMHIEYEIIPLFEEEKKC